MKDVGLKLKPSECRFVQLELEYLCHIVSRDGLKTNPRLTAAVQDFPTSQSVQEVWRFLELVSYYRRFICNFVRIAHPLHQLTCKGACGQMTAGRLSESWRRSWPLRLSLAYPIPRLKPWLRARDRRISPGDWSCTWTVPEGSHKVHPVAYASRVLASPSLRHSQLYGLFVTSTTTLWEHSHCFRWPHIGQSCAGDVQSISKTCQIVVSCLRKSKGGEDSLSPRAWEQKCWCPVVTSTTTSPNSWNCRRRSTSVSNHWKSKVTPSWLEQYVSGRSWIASVF